MSRSLSEQNRWQEVLRQQKQANARQWLAKITAANDLSELVKQEYDNLLRVLENTVRDDHTFDLAFDLIQKLHPFVVGYADWDRWQAYLQQALDHSQKPDRLHQAARLLELVSDLAYLSGDWSQAKAFSDQSLQAYRALDDLHGCASALTRLCAAHTAQGQIEEAIRYGLEAVHIAELTEDLSAVAHSKLTLSQTYYHAHDASQGLNFSQDAFALGMQLELPNLVDKALLNIVACEIALENWAEAEQAARMLEERLSQTEDIQQLSQIKNNLGIIAFQQGDYLAAEQAWQDVLKLHSQMQYPAEAASIRNNLGKVYTCLGEWQVAEEMLRQSVQAYESLGDLYNWANTMDNLADLYEAWGKTAVFRKTLAQAIARISPIADSPPLLELRATMQKRLSSS